MKVASILLAAVFLWIAALQLNDPDSVYWIAVYAGTALVLFGIGIERFSLFWFAVVVGGILSGMLGTVTGFWSYLVAGDYAAIFGDMRGPAFVEETREFLGLAFALAVMFFFRRADIARAKSV